MRPTVNSPNRNRVLNKTDGLAIRFIVRAKRADAFACKKHVWYSE
jgi:hypothetical protein